MTRRVSITEPIGASPQELERLIRARGPSWDQDSPLQAGSSFRVAENQQALVTLILALTDQFADEATTAVAEAWKFVERIRDEHDRAYYAGIIWERRAKARLRRGVPDCGPRAYEWLREAMTWYERAEAIRPPGNDDALLRWNTCARLLMRDHRLVPAAQEREEPLLLE